MFTTGIDLGSGTSVVAVARKGGIDIVANEASYRQTPSLVCFTPEQRFIGQSAASQQRRYVKTTLSNVKRLLGRKFNDPTIAIEQQYQAAQIVEAVDGTVGINTPKYGIVTAVEAAGALLGQLKRTAETSTGHAVRDVVIGVPGNWTDGQRRALLDAASIAGLNALQLINELTAAALELGIRKARDWKDDDTPQVVVFFDMGAGQTQASVVRYSKDKLEILAQESDDQLGGRNFDKALVDHFRDEFLEKYKIDINTNQRARLRVTESCRKMKHVLSSVDNAPINIECLMNDKDVRSKMTRAEFQQLTAPLIERVRAPLDRVMAAAGIAIGDVSEIEVIGDSHRLPAVLNLLENIFGKPPSKRTNATEVVAKGCAWQCARKSPVFRVKPYALLDSQPYAAEFCWAWGENNARPKEAKNYGPLFSSNCVIGKKGFRKVEYKMKDLDTDNRTFETSLKYESGVTLPQGQERTIGTWFVSGIPKNPEALNSEVDVELKLGLKANDSGVFALTKAEKIWTEIEEYEAEESVPLSEEEVAAAQAKAAEKAKSKAAADAKAAKEAKAAEDAKAAEEPKGAEDAKASEEAKPAEEGASETKPVEKVPKKKEEEKVEQKVGKKVEKKEDLQPKTKKVKVTKTRDVVKSLKLTIVETNTTSLSPADLLAAINKEKEAHAADTLVIETGELKNQVESYCYEFRDKLSSNLGPFATEEIKDQLKKLMQSTEDWLYDEGENVDKATYVARLESMQVLGDPIERRHKESVARPEAYTALQNTLNELRAWTATTEEEFAHIDAAERKKVSDKVDEVEGWLNVEMKKQGELPRTQTPILLAKHVTAKLSELTLFTNPIKNKKKPKPVPKKEEPKEKPKEEAKTEPKTDSEPKTESDAKKAKADEEATTTNDTPSDLPPLEDDVPAESDAGKKD